MVDIFKGSIHSLIKNKKPLSEKKFVATDAYPILAADSLLSTDKRQQTMSDTRALLSLPDEEYQKIFLRGTEYFAEFVQNLPETENSYYAGMGGILDHGLERAALSLFLCRTYLLPEDATLSSVSESEMLWVYAVYTAALLYDVGKIATKHRVVLTDQRGNAIKPWLPYAGPMTSENASHYGYGFGEGYYDHMRWMVTPLLARQILPEEGFLWIASDPDVLESWLALLSDEHRQVGSLLTVIPLADAQLLEQYFNFTDRKINFRNKLSPQTIALLAKFQKERKELLKKQKELREKMLAEEKGKSFLKEKEEPKTQELTAKKTSDPSLFGGLQPDKEAKIAITAYSAAEITQRFMTWLQQNAERFATHHEGLHIAKEGVLIDHQVLSRFNTDNNLKLNETSLQQFLTQTKYSQAVSYTIAGQNRQNALIVQNPYLVFPGGPIGPVNPAIQVLPPLPQQAIPAPIQQAAQSFTQQTQTFTPVPRPGHVR